MQTDLWRLGVIELAQAIREKHVSSREVVQAHLGRIHTVNDNLNAVTVVLGEQALRAQLRRLTKRWPRELRLGHCMACP